MRTSNKIITALFLILISMAWSLVMNSNMVAFSEKRYLPIYSVDGKEKKIAVTFDVNWGEDYTLEILDILDKYNVKATFFLVGRWVDDHPEIVKQIYSRGHELGNHTDMHPDLTKVSKERIVNEIAAADAKIYNLTGFQTRVFRCPSGSYNNLVISTVEATGHLPIQWDVDSIDWKEQGAEVELNRVLKKTKPGSILLFHNNAKYTPENLNKVLKYYKEQGYELVKAGDLIYKENYYLDNNGRQFEKN